MILRCIAVTMVLALLASQVASGRPFAESTSVAPDAHRIGAGYGLLPMLFERAATRYDERTQFIARGANYAVAISADGARLALGSPSAAAAPIAIRFVGANPDASIAGSDPQATRLHHIRDAGHRDEREVPAYGRVAVIDVFPGIDVAFHGKARELEYDLIVAPGADPSRIGFRIEAGDRASLDGAGELVLGALRLKRPVAYQDVDGERQRVASEFALDGDGVVRIRVGQYDMARTLVIDPVVSYATYLGGNNVEQGTAIAVDSAGNAYVTGYTSSTDFPMVNALDRSLGKRSDVDVFVSKLNPAGTALVWSTYIGGSASADRAVGIAVDAAGGVYIAGQTSGSDFPTSATAWQKGIATGGAFIAKLAPAGNALVYSTYVIGATPSAIAVDAGGYAYVSGSATSAFLTTPGAMQPSTGNPAGTTAFVLKLDATGSAPVFATFLGGTAGEDATSIAVDARGSTYVGGWTTSSDFPVRSAFQSSRAGGKDGFIASLDPSGSQLVHSTLVGGSLDDAVNAIAVDSAGNAYVAGETFSWDFPVKDGFQMLKAGRRLINSSVGNAFVAKLAPTGDSLVYSTFLGGEVCLTSCQLVFGPQPQYVADAAYGVAVDAAGHAYVTGIARSYTFPLVDSTAPRKQQDNENSAFVAKLTISGGSLLWSTFIRTGFNESDNHWTRLPPGAATGVAVDATGAYVTGDADSASNFQATTGAFQTTSTFGPAAVIAKFSAAPPMTLTTSNPVADAQTPFTLTATMAGPALAGTVTFMDGSSWIGAASLVANSAALTLKLPAGIHALSAVLRIAGSASDTPVLQQIVDVQLVCN
jgi:hypothetical protein